MKPALTQRPLFRGLDCLPGQQDLFPTDGQPEPQEPLRMERDTSQPGPPHLDPNEAPEGYYAVLKSSVPHDQGNLCRFCDWRPVCGQEDTDLTKHNHRCMGYAVVTPDGRTIERRDGCSVVFKLARQANHEDTGRESGAVAN
jgi:hypothetical protein